MKFLSTDNLLFLFQLTNIFLRRSLNSSVFSGLRPSAIYVKLYAKNLGFAEVKSSFFHHRILSKANCFLLKTLRY